MKRRQHSTHALQAKPKSVSTAVESHDQETVSSVKVNHCTMNEGGNSQRIINEDVIPATVKVGHEHTTGALTNSQDDITPILSAVTVQNNYSDVTNSPVSVLAKLKYINVNIRDLNRPVTTFVDGGS